MNRIPDAEVLLTPKEVAQRFHVNPKTVTRWAKAEGGSKIRGGQRSGGAPQVQRKAGPSGSGSAG